MTAQNSQPIFDADLRSLVEALDERVLRDGAWISLSQYGGGPDEGKMTGNRRGYQRLGIEFLKSTLNDDSEESIWVDLDYIVASNSTIKFDWFELSDDPSADKEARRWIQGLVGLGCLMAFLFAATAFLLGVGVMANWFSV